MDYRKQAILNHLAGYRISIRSVIEEHIIGGDASRELNELSRAGLINIYPRVLGGGRSVYQLTMLGAREEGKPVSIASAPKPQGLLANLSLLWFCFCGEKERFRLDPTEQAELLGTTSGDATEEENYAVKYHVLEPRDSGTFIYRAYTPTPRAKIAEIERALYRIAVATNKMPGARALVAAGFYAAVVLVQNADRAKAIKRFLRNRPIAELLRIEVNLVPDFLVPSAAFSLPRRIAYETEDKSVEVEEPLGGRPEGEATNP
jgi:hypothetical protein